MSSRCDPAYAEIIDRLFCFEVLNQQPESVVGLSADDRIIYVNDRWDDFAAANDGQPGIGAHWDLGAHYLGAIPEVVQPFYRDLLARARRAGDALHPVTHEYECSTPSQYRRFNMLVYAVSDGSCVLIVNSLAIERTFADGERPAHAADDSCYRDADGLIHQCSHCRRVRAAASAVEWHWVPGWVARSPAGTSHDLCGLCFRYYYPEPPDAVS